MDLFYVGFRESDICCSSNFAGSITKYGTNSGTNISFSNRRLNAFCSNKELLDFYKCNILKILTNNPKAKFVFYNPIYAYMLGEDVYKSSVGVNSLSLLQLFNDKFFVRQFVSNFVECPQSYVLDKKFINKECLNIIFRDPETIVIQEEGGSGGSTTEIYEIHDLTKINFNKNQYLISTFVKDSIPISTHLLITDNDIHCFQPSIQIIKHQKRYYGGDFISTKYISEEIITKVKDSSVKIANKMAKLGYRGVVGMDFVISKNKVYFIEINLRFMGSTLLLNRHLIKKGKKTLQEMHIDACNHKKIDLKDYNFKEMIPLSNLIVFNAYEEKELPPNYIEKVLDGYNATMILDEDSYLYTVLYDKGIAKI